jgi:regulator of protease activity HflC (stomatin/prohibitin superfamily)
MMDIRTNDMNKGKFVEKYSTAERNECYEAVVRCYGNCCGTLTTWVCVCCPSPYKSVPESQYGIVKEFGKFTKVLRPGLHYINPIVESLTLVDSREKVIDLKQQSIMTKDNVNVKIDAVVYYKVEDAYRALFAVQNVEMAVAEIAKTALRDVFGHTMLQEALETKEKMARHIRELIEKPTYNWGVTITRVLIQEILFSKDLQQNLSAAATAKRLAEGKIISAQADVDSAKLMREAADQLNTRAAMQIRYLDALTTLAKASNTKVIFMPGETTSKK